MLTSKGRRVTDNVGAAGAVLRRDAVAGEADGVEQYIKPGKVSCKALYFRTNRKGVDDMAGTNTNISIRMDAELKAQADALFAELGMDLSTAFNIFVRQSLREGRIPFEISPVGIPCSHIREMRRRRSRSGRKRTRPGRPKRRSNVSVSWQGLAFVCSTWG